MVKFKKRKKQKKTDSHRSIYLLRVNVLMVHVASYYLWSISLILITPTFGLSKLVQEMRLMKEMLLDVMNDFSSTQYQHATMLFTVIM
jgi:hypothetical protein